MDKDNNQDLVAIFFDLDNTLIPTRIADLAASNKVILYTDLYFIYYL